MENQIDKFLKYKSTPGYEENKNKFESFSILYQGLDGFLDLGFIQDANVEVNNYEHKLTVVILNSSKTEFFTIVKTCKAPEECIIDWDTVQCKTEIF